MMHLFILTILTILALTPDIASAGCTKDLDCDGADVCVSGVCTTATSPQPGTEVMSTSISATDTAASTAAPQPTEADASPADGAPSAADTAAGAPAPVAHELIGQCLKDTDCKGNRICQQGVCQDPTLSSASPPAAPSAVAAASPALISDGWALGGGVAGLATIIPITALGVASAVTSDEQLPSIPLGATATILIAAMGPIAFGAGKSARRGAGVRGAMGLRISGWIVYGISLVNAISLIGLGVADVEVAPWQIALTTAFGDIALVLLSTDAIIASGQARRKRASAALDQSAERRPSIAPSIAPIFGPDGITGAVAGVGAVF